LSSPITVSPTARKLSLVFALAGLAASIGAGWVHYRLLADPRYASFCDISATVSCTQVYASRFGTFGGIPVALFGVIFFALVLLLLAAARSTRVRVNVPGYLFAASTVGLAVSLYLGYASLFLLKAVCLLCLATYAAVVGLFIVSGAATEFPLTSLPRRAAQDVRVWIASPLAIAITVLFLGGVASAITLLPREASADASAPPAPATQAQQSDFAQWYTSQPRVPLVIPKEGAKVLVVKFNDYQCPPCRQSYLQYEPIFQKYEKEQPGAVRVVYKDFPLSSECNKYIQNGGPHPAACEAAVAVRLASFRTHQPMVDWLFANQPMLTPQLVRQAAREVGGETDFEQKYQPTLELVRGDIELGHELGVRSTPTFFINGVKIEGALPPQFFEQAIQYELQHAQ
jgi:uncharacterized membrane protein/protein-disulfide isomerase